MRDALLALLARARLGVLLGEPAARGGRWLFSVGLQEIESG